MLTKPVVERSRCRRLAKLLIARQDPTVVGGAQRRVFDFLAT